MDSHEQSFQQLTGAVDKLCATVKSHSFQIVSMQNQIQVIQNERKQEAEERAELKQNNTQLQTKIAYLKGKLAKLTVEFYSAQAVASGDTASPHDREARCGTPRRPAHRGNISSATCPRNHVADTADQFSVEQTSPLESELMSQPLDAQTKNGPNELDQMHFYDARENITDDGSKIKTGGGDDDFSLEPRLLQALTAANFI